MKMAVSASSTKTGILEVLDDDQTVIGTSLLDAQAGSITMKAIPSMNGCYFGAFEGREQGDPVTINYYRQVVTDAYAVSFLTWCATVEGITCAIYRPFEMIYNG